CSAARSSTASFGVSDQLSFKCEKNFQISFDLPSIHLLQLWRKKNQVAQVRQSERRGAWGQPLKGGSAVVHLWNSQRICSPRTALCRPRPSCAKSRRRSGPKGPACRRQTAA